MAGGGVARSSCERGATCTRGQTDAGCSLSCCVFVSRSSVWHSRLIRLARSWPAASLLRLRSRVQTTPEHTTRKRRGQRGGRTREGRRDGGSEDVGGTELGRLHPHATASARPFGSAASAGRARIRAHPGPGHSRRLPSLALGRTDPASTLSNATNHVRSRAHRRCSRCRCCWRRVEIRSEARPEGGPEGGREGREGQAQGREGGVAAGSVHAHVAGR